MLAIWKGSLTACYFPVRFHSSQIWTEDRHTLTCQDDPYCVEFSSFKPTNEKYPGTAIDESTHLPDFWNDIYSDPQGPPPQRWAWLNHELSRIPEEERGTIPAYKLFTATYVSREMWRLVVDTFCHA